MLATVLTVATTVTGMSRSSSAQEAPNPTAEVVAELSPELADVPATSPVLDGLEDALARARSAREQATAALAELRPAKSQLIERVARAEDDRHRTTKRLAYIEAAINALAVASYTEGGTAAVPALDPASATDHQEREVLASTVNAAQVADRDRTEEDRDDAIRELRLSRALLDNVVTRIAEAEAAELRAARDELDLAPQVATARVLAQVEGADFPLVALDAYFRGATTLASEDPSCGVRWWALAGISRVEGRHGTYGGSALEADGDVTRPIIGIPLPAVGETDGGLLDGDPTVDHAVGPMQFIPSTWRRWGRDGNGDGVADPQNLYDGALSAAAYLCASGPGLDTDAGLRRAYFSYNHSRAYVEQVLGHARDYERAVPLD